MIWVLWTENQKNGSSAETLSSRRTKEVKYSTLMATKPEFAMRLAVKGMLPKNSIGAASIARLKIYAGSEHKQQAQQPVPYTGA